MAAYEVLLLNTAIPQIQAAQSGDTYVVPRDIAFTSNLTLNAGTANGVVYLNASKVATTGSALTFDGTNLGVGGTASSRFSTSTSLIGNNGYANAFRMYDDASASTSQSSNSYGFGFINNNALSYTAGTSGTHVFFVGNSEQMRLTSTGLGIGTNSPGVKLHVADGDTRISQSGTGNIGLNILRSAGTTADWYNYIPSGSSDLRWFLGTDLLTLTASGNLAIANGNLVMSTSGKGIDFSATSSGTGTMTSELLDDYEEGTFTPTLSGGYSTAPTSYTEQSGSYTKIGRYVYFQIDIDANGAVANANAITIGGLPFTSFNSSTGGFGGANVSYQAGFNTNATDTYHISLNTSIIGVYDDAGAGRAGNAAGVNLNSRIILFGSYQTET